MPAPAIEEKEVRMLDKIVEIEKMNFVLWNKNMRMTVQDVMHRRRAALHSSGDNKVRNAKCRRAGGVCSFLHTHRFAS
jgi:hypothetical protein